MALMQAAFAFTTTWLGSARYPDFALVFRLAITLAIRADGLAQQRVGRFKRHQLHARERVVERQQSVEPPALSAVAKILLRLRRL